MGLWLNYWDRPITQIAKHESRLFKELVPYPLLFFISIVISQIPDVVMGTTTFDPHPPVLARSVQLPDEQPQYMNDPPVLEVNAPVREDTDNLDSSVSKRSVCDRFYSNHFPLILWKRLYISFWKTSYCIQWGCPFELWPIMYIRSFTHTSICTLFLCPSISPYFSLYNYHTSWSVIPK